MFPYFFILILLIALAVIEQFIPIGKNRMLRTLLAIGLILFAAFRSNDVDKDYESYVNSFELFNNPGDYFKNFQDWIFFEPMYYLIPSFFKTYLTSIHFSLFTFIFFAIIGVSLKFKGVGELSKFFCLSLLCYFCYFFMLHEMTQIRAGIASGVLLLSIPLLYRKKYIPFFLMVLVATLFHYSALFILPFIFLNTKNPNPKFYWSLLAITLLLSFTDTSFIFYLLQFDLGPLTIRSNNYKNFAEEGILNEINKLNIVFIITFATSVISLYYSKLLEEKNKYLILLGKIQIWGLFLFQFFSAIPGIAFRLTDLYTIVTIITFTNYCYLFKNKLIGFAIPVVFTIGLLLINLYYSHLLKSYHIIPLF